MSNKTGQHMLEKHMLDDSMFQAKFERLILGDPETQEIGMKKKVDEMHAILVSVKGLVWVFGFIVALGSALLFLKSWFWKV